MWLLKYCALLCQVLCVLYEPEGWIEHIIHDINYFMDSYSLNMTACSLRYDTIIQVKGNVALFDISCGLKYSKVFDNRNNCYIRNQLTSPPLGYQTKKAALCLCSCTLASMVK